MHPIKFICCHNLGKIQGLHDNFTFTFEAHAKPGSYLYVDQINSPFHLKVGESDGRDDFNIRASWYLSNGLNCSQEGSFALTSAGDLHYYLAFCNNELMMLLDTGTWTRCKTENFDLNKNGCWNVNPYNEEFRVDLFKTDGASVGA